MKKAFTFIFATMVAMGALAQTNLAAGKTSIATSGTAALGNDGDNGTRWESASADPQAWQVDLGEVTEFNTVSIRWEGAYAATFTIEAGNEVGDDGFVTDATVIATVEGQTLAGFPYVQNLAVGTQNFRYVKFNGTARGTAWGYSFWEFGVYDLTEPLTLSALTLTAGAAEVALGTNVALTVAGTDQLGGAIAAGDLTWVVADEAVGTVQNGEFVPAAAGTTTVKAVSGTVESNEVAITVIAGEKINLFNDWNIRIYNLGLATSTSKVGAFDDNMASTWDMLGKESGADEASRTYDVGFIADLRGIYNVSSISIMFEGACSEAFTLAFAGEDGVFGESVYSGGATGINAHTETFADQTVEGVRYVKFLSTKAATQWSVKLFDFAVYGTKVADVADTEAPVITAATGTADESSATLTITATDNSSKYLTYEVGGVAYALGTNVAGEPAEVVIENLNGGTEYTFSIVAVDAFGNRSEATEVTVTTGGEEFILTAAPAPEHAAENVIAVYSNAYEPATTFNIGWWSQATAVSYDTVEGDEIMHLTNFNYLGFEFANDLDLSEMEYVHIDVLPRQAMNLGFTPIMRNAPTENPTLVGELTVNEWNSIDLPLSAIGLTYTGNTAFQLKFDQGNASQELYIDNVYFYKTATEPETVTFEGYVRNDQEEALAGVTVTATLVTDEPEGLRRAEGDNAYETTTDENGHYSLTVPAGEYNLTFVLDGYKSLTVPASQADEVILEPDTNTAVSDVNATKTVAGVTYVNAAGQVSNSAFDGVNVVVTTYTDGTSSTAKVVK